MKVDSSELVELLIEINEAINFSDREGDEIRPYDVLAACDLADIHAHRLIAKIEKLRNKAKEAEVGETFLMRAVQANKAHKAQRSGNTNNDSETE